METSVNLLKYYMKKVHFILWFIQAVLFSTVVEAAPIDHKEAIRIADKFMFSNRENILDKCERAISELNQLCGQLRFSKPGGRLCDSRFG